MLALPPPGAQEGLPVHVQQRVLLQGLGAQQTVVRLQEHKVPPGLVHVHGRHCECGDLEFVVSVYFKVLYVRIMMNSFRDYM